MLIIGIDPGPEQSGICIIEAGKPLEVKIRIAEKMHEHRVKDALISVFHGGKKYEVAMEGMVYQGRGFGQSSIQTCYLIGRIQEYCSRYGIPLTLYSRREYGQWITAGGQLNDVTLRAALEAIYGKSAKKDDPLYPLKGATDKRSAFALAKYHEHKLREAKKL